MTDTPADAGPTPDPTPKPPKNPHTLFHPVRREGRPAITSVTMRRVKMRDRHLAALEQPDNEVLRESEVIRLSSGLDREDYDEVDMADFVRLKGIYLGFLKGS